MVLKSSELENIEIIWDTTVESIQGEGLVESITIYNKKKEEQQVLPVQGVFVAVGIQPNSELFRNALDMDGAGYICASEDGVTSQPGIFVAGDVRTKQLRQIITAAADGANAVTSVENYLLQ